MIPRKGIEFSIELVHRLKLKNPVLYITHSTNDEGFAYLQWLQREADVMGIQLKLLENFIGAKRATINGHKLYSLWDVYPHVNLVTCPSQYEGFGNGLLESIYFKLPTLVNRYPVYNADFLPLGFERIELDGFLHEQTVLKVKSVLEEPDSFKEATQKNYQIALENFSYVVLQRKLSDLLQSF